jgi:hypothetical protein
MKSIRSPETARPVRWDAELIERLARALHDQYRRHTADGDDAAGTGWAELTQSMQASNLEHAAHIQVKLAAIGCIAAPDEPPGRSFEFAPGEVELLADMEHDRWVRERIDNEWRPGRRDSTRKTTPYLVGWDDLTEEMRELDRMFVRQIPIVLKSLGLQIVRCTGTR